MPFGAGFVLAFFVLPAFLGCDVEDDVLFVVLSGFGFCVLSEAADENDFVEHGFWLRFFWFVRCLRYMLAQRVCTTQKRIDNNRPSHGRPMCLSMNELSRSVHP